MGVIVCYDVCADTDSTLALRMFMTLTQYCTCLSVLATLDSVNSDSPQWQKKLCLTSEPRLPKVQLLQI